MNLSFKIDNPWRKLYDDVKIPEYAHAGDAAQDIRLHLTPEKLEYLEYYSQIYSTDEKLLKFRDACTNGSIELAPGEWFLMPTGLCVEIPEGVVLTINCRSGMGAKGFTINNSPGIIDSGYRYENPAKMAEIFVILRNDTGHSLENELLDTANIISDLCYDLHYKQQIFELDGVSEKAGKPQNFSNGDRIAQALFLPYIQVGESSNNTRSGGLGSSGL